MINFRLQNSSNDNFRFSGDNLLMQAFFLVGALISAFLIFFSGFSFYVKSVGFLAVLLYLFFCSTFYSRQKRRANREEKSDSATLFNAVIEGRLLALEEASRFFGASLKFSDMFRLVSSRVNEMIPFVACAIFMPDENKDNLRIAASAGECSENLTNRVIKINECLAGRTFASRKAQIDHSLLFDENALPFETRKKISSALSVPLFSNGEIFAILVVYGDENSDYNQNSLELLEAIGERVAPLFTSAKAYERSVANALTDVLTALPNERAFYLVLENKIAEAQRFPDERSLSVLTIDIKNFAEINQKFGHAVGDRVLSFTAGIIKERLRDMDFLSRSFGDEFLAVLPSAPETIMRDVIERIEKAFAANHFKISERESLQVRLNFGAATFLKDGETAQRLLERAHLRKRQAKSSLNNQVLWFPQNSAG